MQYEQPEINNIEEFFNKLQHAVVQNTPKPVKHEIQEIEVISKEDVRAQVDQIIFPNPEGMTITEYEISGIVIDDSVMMSLISESAKEIIRTFMNTKFFDIIRKYNPYRKSYVGNDKLLKEFPNRAKEAIDEYIKTLVGIKSTDPNYVFTPDDANRIFVKYEQDLREIVQRLSVKGPELIKSGLDYASINISRELIDEFEKLYKESFEGVIASRLTDLVYQRLKDTKQPNSTHTTYQQKVEPAEPKRKYPILESIADITSDVHFGNELLNYQNIFEELYMLNFQEGIDEDQSKLWRKFLGELFRYIAENPQFKNMLTSLLVNSIEEEIRRHDALKNDKQKYSELTPRINQLTRIRDIIRNGSRIATTLGFLTRYLIFRIALFNEDDMDYKILTEMISNQYLQLEQ